MKLSKHVLPAALILALGFFTFTSCEKNPNGNPDDDGNTGGGNEDSTQVDPPVQETPVLYPESTDTIKVASEGGQFSFNYVLENPVEGIEVTATSGNDWISEITCPGDGTVSFNVAANQEYAGREGSIRIEYPYSETEEPLYFETIIAQEAVTEPAPVYDIELEGKIYGQYMGSAEPLYSTYRYNFFLSDNGFTESGTLLPNSVYIRMDIFSDSVPEDMNAIFPAEGTYTIDFSKDYPAMTLSGNDCYYMMIDGSGLPSNTWWFEECTCTVEYTESGYRIDIVALLADDGRTLHAWYEGDEPFKNYSIY